jgi:hypothetical protein
MNPLNKIYPLLLLLTLNCFSLWAQKQTANWMMFPDSYHFALSRRNISSQYKDTFSFSSSMSDKNGNLLFYTNGFDVWNKLGEKMQGSGFILNSFPFRCCGSQGIPCVIVPSPSDTNQFYIFGSVYTGQHYHPTSYAIVDMAVNGQIGKIISTRNIIDTNTSNVISAVKHCNNKDYWIITHRQQTNTFLAILLSSTGVSPPVESSIGGRRMFSINNRQMMKVSPNGKYVALVCSDSANNDADIIYVFPFDNKTGSIKAPILKYIDSEPGPSRGSYGNIEFSSNSIRFYIANSQSRLIQFDLSNPDPAAIKKSADSLNLDGAKVTMMQLSLNNKIYLLSYPSILSIDYPQLKIANPSFSLHKQTGYSINYPFFVSSYFNQPYTVDSFCLHNPTVFRALDAYQYDSLRWDFGDSLMPLHSSIDSITHHTYTTSGMFTATLKGYKCNSETVFEIPISISNPTPIIFDNLDSLCINTPPLKLNMATPDSGMYFINDQLTKTLNPSLLGVGTAFIVYKIMNDSGCLTADSTPITINPLPTPVISLNRSPFLCEGESVTLLSNYNTNKWSNGDTSKSINIYNTSTISLTVTDSNGCKNTSLPVSIQSKKIPTTKIAPVSPVLCEGTVFTLDASGEGDFYWNNGYRGNKQELLAAYTQTYKVTVSNYCGSTQDSVHIIVLRSSAKAYPNPTQTHLTVDLSECEGQGQSIEILDEIGRRMYYMTTDNFSEIINVSSLADGLYFCWVGKENLSVFKFVVIR